MPMCVCVCECQYGFTLLHDSCENGNLAATTLLLDRGADVNVKNQVRDTHTHTQFLILHTISTWHPHTRIYLLISIGPYLGPHVLELFAHTHIRNAAFTLPVLFCYTPRMSEHMPMCVCVCFSQYGYTPLHYSCRNGHLGVTTLLLDRGADVNVAHTRTRDIYVKHSRTYLIYTAEVHSLVPHICLHMLCTLMMLSHIEIGCVTCRCAHTLTCGTSDLSTPTHIYVYQ